MHQIFVFFVETCEKHIITVPWSFKVSALRKMQSYVFFSAFHLFDGNRNLDYLGFVEMRITLKKWGIGSADGELLFTFIFSCPTASSQPSFSLFAPIYKYFLLAMHDGMRNRRTNDAPFRYFQGYICYDTKNEKNLPGNYSTFLGTQMHYSLIRRK